MRTDDRPARLLVVEDDEEIRNAVREVLEDEGYAVDDFATAEAGLAALRSCRYDAVLSDEMLPANPGSWMLAVARSEGLLEATGVIVLSALILVPIHPSHVHLTKPVDLFALLAETAKCVERSGAAAARASLNRTA